MCTESLSVVRCVINNTQIGCCIASCYMEGTSYFLPPRCHNFLLWNQEFHNFVLHFFIFDNHLKKHCVAEGFAYHHQQIVFNCWNPLSLVWKCVEGTVCVMCLAQKVVRKKKAAGLGGQEVHTFGWINFVCIGCWVRSLNMSLYIGVCLRLWFFHFDFVWFWGCLWLW
jgi:hypothetical protein